MSFRPAFNLVRALKTAFETLLPMWRQGWLALLILFALVLAGQSSLIDGLGLWGRRAAIVLAVLFQFVAIGALYRIALFGRYARAEGLGFGGVQVGKPERRLILAGFFVALFWLMIFVTLAVVLALFLSAAGFSDHVYATPSALIYEFLNGAQPQGIILLLSLGVSVFTLVILAIKLWLHQAATVAEHQVVSLNALTLSSGQTVKLLLGYVYLVLPFIALSALMPRATGVLSVTALVNLVLGIGLFLPLSVGFFAAAYRQIVDLRA